MTGIPAAFRLHLGPRGVFPRFRNAVTPLKAAQSCIGLAAGGGALMRMRGECGRPQYRVTRGPRGGQDSVMVTWGLWEGVPRGRRGFFFSFLFFGVTLQNECKMREGQGGRGPGIITGGSKEPDPRWLPIGP